MPRPKSVAGFLTPEDAGLPLFDRSAATWRRLRAPLALTDVDAAAEKAADIAPSLESLEHEEGVDRASLHHLLARRYWAWSRPKFLAEVGALTTAELEHLARFPKLHSHNSEDPR